MRLDNSENKDWFVTSKEVIFDESDLTYPPYTNGVAGMFYFILPPEAHPYVELRTSVMNVEYIEYKTKKKCKR